MNDFGRHTFRSLSKGTGLVFVSLLMGWSFAFTIGGASAQDRDRREDFHSDGYWNARWNLLPGRARDGVPMDYQVARGRHKSVCRGF